MEIPETILFCAEILRETEKAYLVNDGAQSVWIPKSQITSMVYTGKIDYDFTIPGWLASKNNLI